MFERAHKKRVALQKPRKPIRQHRKKAGHRSWAAGNAPVPGGHQGDTMSAKTRSRVMASIKGKNTTPERIVFTKLRRRKVYFTTHAKDLPGRPDVVFRRVKLAIFVDGDFWHGWRFPLWRHKLSKKWQEKISDTRERDQRNFRKLRRLGWKVLRIWEHQIERAPEECVDKILSAREQRAASGEAESAAGRNR